uniref:Reverse transcriptase domain, reverse transcriptase zinc-binding domain protein n=1 Tax=Tanacetum cinerariifolium TaxID=118510 RepID=A0A699HYI8_TANCI|nr:reverse transcriptase domain, reverse transcriptase zinc-binding domain protein [Tanacetum cinerariifolium]
MTILNSSNKYDALAGIDENIEHVEPHSNNEEQIEDVEANMDQTTLFMTNGNVTVGASTPSHKEKEEVHEEYEVELVVDIFDDLDATKVDLDFQKVSSSIDGESLHKVLVDLHKSVGFSLLERLEETIKVGLVLGLNIEGFENTLAALTANNGEYVLIDRGRAIDLDLLNHHDSIHLLGDLDRIEATDLSQKIGLTGSESRPPMLNKENYVPWSSRLLRYAKSRPNGKLIHNSILNGPYVRKMIPELGDANREITVTETFHLQTDNELSEMELKQIEADDQAIQTIILGLPEDIYAVERFTSNEEESIESYYHHFLKLMNDLKRNKHFLKKIASNLKFLNNLQLKWSRHVTIVHQTMDLHTADYTQLYDFLKHSQKETHLQQPMPNPEDIIDPTTAMNMVLALMAKSFKLNYSTPTNNNQRISSNPRNRLIAQPGMNMGQDRQMQMVGGNGNQNQIRNGNLVAARAENMETR